MELWDPPWKCAFALKSPCLSQFPASRTGEVWQAFLAVFIPLLSPLCLAIQFIIFWSCVEFEENRHSERNQNFQNSRLHIFILGQRRAVILRCSHVWCLLEERRVLIGKKKKGAERKLLKSQRTAGKPRAACQRWSAGYPAGTDCHDDVFIPVYAKAGSRGGFSAPAADSEHLLLCTAAPMANKFYGAMAWLGSYPFCKPKAGNMQRKMHMCIFFDIHREHSCLLPGARGVGMGETILQSPQLSPH